MDSAPTTAPELITMFSEPVIVDSKSLSLRGYVYSYINGKRYRLYNGRAIGITCNPNRAQSIKEKTKSLNHLCFEFKKKLEQGWIPVKKVGATIQLSSAEPQTMSMVIKQIPAMIVGVGLSEVYERDLNKIYLQFTKWIEQSGLGNQLFSEFKPADAEKFLQQFKSSGTNYMNRRRTLSALFTRLKDIGIIEINPVTKTKKIKQTAHLNVPFKTEQMKTLLTIIQKAHPELYLCSLLMYGCFLRPHREIRLLKRDSFDDGLTTIRLSGNANKSRRIRTVPVPEYVREELLKRRVDEIETQHNIFSKCPKAYNEYYFDTAWSRIKENLLKEGIVSQHHTLYSFRHTAAVNMYLKTKDPFKIQKAFGHSSLRVTLMYLRNLGMLIDASLEDLPNLP